MPAYIVMYDIREDEDKNGSNERSRLQNHCKCCS